MARSQAERICSEYRIAVRVLYSLGDLLLNYNDAKYRSVATKLLICAVDRGVDMAAERLLTDAILTGVSKGPGVAAARKLIQDYAANGISSSVYLEGKMLEHEGNPLKALQLYQNWSDNHTEILEKSRARSASTPEAGDVCKALAILRAKLGDRKGAEEAIRNAALVYDDPLAYYHLAIEFTTPGSAEFETYLLKAASSDEPKASHELGIFYFNQSRQGISLDTPDLWKGITDKNSFEDIRTISTPPVGQEQSEAARLEQRSEAMEWFNIAAESGITASQVYFALLLRDAGRAEEGHEWLQSATRSADAENWAEAVKYLKRIWRLSSPDPMRMDIESLRQSSTNSKKGSTSRLAALEDATLLTHRFQHMKKVDGQWRMHDPAIKKFGERIAATCR
ncbi:MAG: hypothetical protein Q9224_004282 [Gallowayella concinna]